MQQVATPIFTSEISLTKWLLSLIRDKEETINSPIAYFQFQIITQDNQLYLDVKLVFNYLVNEFDEWPTIVGAGCIEVSEQTIKDFRGKWSSCRAEIENNSKHIPYPGIASEFITYSVPCFINKAKSV